MRHLLVVFFVTLIGCFLAWTVDATAARAAKPKKDVSGLWYTQDRDGVVELYHCGDEVCGRFYWMKASAEDESNRDTRNPDPEKRERPLCKMQFMGGFTPDGEGRYSDGWIYSPRSGSTYDAEITLVDSNTLDLRGYVLTPALGESQTWKRAKKIPACRPSKDKD